MADLGVGDVVVTEPQTGAVAGMLTDRDIVLRVVAHRLDAPTIEVGTICTRPVTTIPAGASVGAAVELMCNAAVRRLPVVDPAGRPVGIVSIGDLAGSESITDHDLRLIVQSQAAAHRWHRISPALWHRPKASESGR